MDSCKAEDKKKSMSMIVVGLRGEAAQTAMDLGIETILSEYGLKKLTEAIRGHVFPQARAEAKELYKVGHKARGALSRQQGEN